MNLEAPNWFDTRGLVRFVRNSRNPNASSGNMNTENKEKNQEQLHARTQGLRGSPNVDYVCTITAATVVSLCERKIQGTLEMTNDTVYSLDYVYVEIYQNTFSKNSHYEPPTP